MQVHQKIKHFIWKMLNRAIAINIQIQKRIHDWGTLCPICGEKEESIEHAIPFCSHAKATWLRSRLGLLSHNLHIQHIQDWWNMITNIGREKEGMILKEAALICWSIWLMRNKVVFENMQPRPKETLKRIQGLVNDCQMCFWIGSEQPKSTTLTSHASPGGWSKRLNGVIKINCDATFDQQTGCARVAAIARNRHGAVVDVVNMRINAQNVYMAEAEAIRITVNMEIRNRWRRVIIESDSKVIVDALNNQAQEPLRHLCNSIVVISRS